MSPALLIVLCGWLVTFFSLAGLGYIVRGVLGRRGVGAWGDAFWLGYAAAIALLQLWQLALPIQWQATLLLAILGGAGLVIAVGQSIWRVGRRIPALRTIIFALVL